MFIQFVRSVVSPVPDLWSAPPSNPFLTHGFLQTPPVSNLRIITWLSQGRLCKQAADCVSGTEVKVRDGDPLQYLIWWCPSGVTKGLFLIVTSRGTHGELETMFAPHEGKDYFDDQEGEQIN